MKKRKIFIYLSLALSLVLVFNFILTKNAKNSELSLLGLSMNIAHAQSECPDDEEDDPIQCFRVCYEDEDDFKGTWYYGYQNFCRPGQTDCSPYYCDANAPC